MRRFVVGITVFALATCTTGDNLSGPDAVPTRALGMNDVTILVPLPAELETPVLDKLRAAAPTLIPVNLVTGLVLASEIGPKLGGTIAHDDIHIVAVRFDPCSRDKSDHIGQCTDTDDGRLRLVLQPLYVTVQGVGAHDIALHAFYPIPRADWPAVVTELREMAAASATPLDAPLGISASLASDPDGAYARRLRALIARYARADRLVQLTAIGQDKLSAGFAWLFGGYEKRGETWELISIPTLASTRQHVQVEGGDTIYQNHPSVDTPYRIGLAMNGAQWAAASDEERRLGLETLAEIENPTRHDTNDLQCVVCHVSTFLSAHRARSMGFDLDTLARRFETTRNVSVDTLASRDGRVVRALGWVAQQPAIAKRVANDTAYVLDELERRFPGTAPAP